MKQIKFIFLFLLCQLGWAQQVITGTVIDAAGTPLPGVNIIEKGTNNGTVTDFNGVYTLEASPTGTLVFSYIGFTTEEVAINNQATIDVTLISGNALEEIVLVGTRSLPRSNTVSALPVDILPAEELASTGQVTFDKALQYKIPSFNTVQTPVNDATSLLDPYEIRNMGPSRTLILINGKRKNLSSLLYTQTSPGRGETGADISGIPTEAIKRVEILRDGASAQYGSDAIAGVMNIVLKDDADTGAINLRTGFTSEGDGENYGINIQNGVTVGDDDKGFVNYTVDFSKVNLANRPGTVDAQGEAGDFGADLADVQEFLALFPDAGNINGSPETAASKFLINGGYQISDATEVYVNAAYVYKKVNSFANYRTPYWRTEEDFPYLADFFPNGPGGSYIGYLPTFEGDLNDYNGTIGFITERNNWRYDVSYTTGGNSQSYKVNNTHNRSDTRNPDTFIGDINNNGTIDLTPFDFDGDGTIEANEGVELIRGGFKYRENSPISFDPGGTSFKHNVGNIDISRLLSDKVSIGFGAEFRSEIFEIFEGDEASYEGGGADSFSGNRPENSGKFTRYNFGGYFDLSADITEQWLVNGTIRLEDYSDFGEAFVWKVSSSYRFFEDRLTLRSSVSTGFRAPTLHQIFTQKAQFSFVAGSGIQVGGLINNVSPQANLLDIPKLDAEKSTNFTAGIGAKINNNISLTADYYNIAVEDRIVLSTEIQSTDAGNTPLDQVLQNNNLSDISFFINAIDTRTSGVDVVASYRNIGLGNGTLGFNLSGNYTIQNEREGAVNNPELIENAGQSVVNETQEALFFTSRPQTKWILGGDYRIGKFAVSLNNTYFGKTTFRQQGLDTNLKTEFIPKIVTDLGISVNASDKISVSLNVNNIFDILPEWEFKALNAEGTAILNDPAQLMVNSNLITFNQRYSQMTYDGYHFSQLGTLFNITFTYKL
ncbi:TonB-dependent receptor [Aquimarina sp. ERC-38]|uniref:TonB-dependent receptor n=1 Tax=Aquimarina sp. ERC-38 TaxID=2949996 RepID=UPI00224540C7|nr:TonB-dependent receptor [Aquimarina sp. ERC-38]UZO79697.1 TonB-dependent receptor [Aquimarina sp. ERC-38]